MRIAVASGKGGTGKTTVAVGLARASGRCVLVDCDVEAPNARLFINPEIEGSAEVEVMVPAFERDKCTGCAECSRVCRFNALAALGKEVIIFPELCHGCGGCIEICKPKALTESSRPIGLMEWGSSGRLRFYDASLNVGEPMSPPLIKAVKEKALSEDSDLVILDCPPGATCPMVEAVRGSDFCLLVTEPTSFGLHDLEMAAKALSKLGIPAGVVVNRFGMGDAPVEEVCAKIGLPVLARVPYSMDIAKAYAKGLDIIEAAPEQARIFKELPDLLARRIAA